MTVTRNGDIRLEWKMTRAERKIHVTYKVHNEGKQRLYVCDGLVVSPKPPKYIRSSNVAVEAAGADTALITVGTPSGDVPGVVAPPGFYVPVEPGATFEAARDLDFPFRRWDAMGREVPLPGKFKQASFVLHAFLGEPPTWRELPGEDGAPIRVPEGFTPVNLKGDAARLP